MPLSTRLGASWLFTRRLRSAGEGGGVKLNVGAGGTAYEGWLSAEKHHLDITRPDKFSRILRGVRVHRVLAEHVIEHVYREEFERFLRGIKPFMLPGGTVRIAVPDAMHPSEYVRILTQPGGLEPGADDHKEFYSIATMSEIADSIGCALEPVEYFDEEGMFHRVADDWTRGYISRSFENYRGRFTNDQDELKKLLGSLPERAQEQFLSLGITYTSLIVDFVV